MTTFENVPVYRETKQRLRLVMKKADTYDAFLNKLIDQFEGKYGRQ